MENKTKGVVCMIIFSLAFFVLSLLGYFGNRSDYFTDSSIPLLGIGFLSLFLAVYYFSHIYSEKRKKIAFYINLIVLFFVLVASVGIINEEFGIFVIGLFFLIFIAGLVLSLLIAQFYQYLEKIRYSFIGLFNFFILFFVFDIFTSEKLRYSGTLKGILDMMISHTIISFFVIFGEVAFILLLVTNIFLNKKATKESKKKKILIYLIPVIFLIILLIIWVIDKFILRV